MGRYLLCRSGEARLALPLDLVRRVVDPSEARELGGETKEGAPAEVELEGARIPLIDLSDWNAAAGEHPGNLLVLQEKGLTLGLFVDKMLGVRDEKSVSRHDVPARLGGFCRGLSGLVRAGRSLYLLLDPAAKAKRQG